MSRGYFHRLKLQIKDGELGLVATSLAYSTVLSLIPFVAVCLAILQKMGGVELIYPKVEKLLLLNFSTTTGAEGMKMIRAAITRMLSGKLGFAGAIFLVITSTRMIFTMENGINRVWSLENKRTLAQRVFFHWIAIFLFPFGLATWVALNSMKSLGDLSSRVPDDAIHLAMLFLILTMVYKVVPNIRVRWAAAITGGGVGAIALILIHKSFVWATVEVFNYGKIYGGIAALPLFLLWVLVMWYGILIGAIVSASTTPRARGLT